MTVTERVALALAEDRIAHLEREVARLRGALRAVVDVFTVPDLPDVTPPE